MYDPREEPPRSGPPKSELQRMLAEAVRNTGGSAPAAPSREEPVILRAPPEPVRPSSSAEEQPPRKRQVVGSNPTAGSVPTADQVAKIVVACCRHTGAADPTEVLTQRPVKGGHPSEWPVNRARTMASLAVKVLWGHLGWDAVSRMLGSSTASLTTADIGRRKGRLHWWDEGAFARILDAAREDLGGR